MTEIQEFHDLPVNGTLCQLLAWLFHSKSEGKQFTNSFLKFRELYSHANFEIKKTKLKLFCAKHSKYLIYSGKSKNEEAFVQAHPSCNNVIFKEKLRQVAVSNKKPEDVWSIEPLISDDAIVRVKNSAFQKCEQHTSTLIKEWCKRLSGIAKENLYADLETKEQLLGSCKSLKEMAEDLGMSPIHLAQVLLGMKAFKNPSEVHSDARKLQIIEQAKQLSSVDLLFGYLMNESAEKRLMDNGNYGEQLVEADLEKLGVLSSAYKTERQQILASTELSPTLVVTDVEENRDSVGAPLSEVLSTVPNGNGTLGGMVEPTKAQPEPIPTPDFLFDLPVTLFGKQVKWIEVKNFVIVPGVSDDSTVQRFVAQVSKYFHRFGHGMVIFTRTEGFSQSLLDLLLEVDVTVATRRHNEKVHERAERNFKRNIYQHSQTYRGGYSNRSFEGDIWQVMGHSFFQPKRLVAQKPVGHVLGGTLTKEEYIERLQSTLKKNEAEARERFAAEICSVLQLEEDMFAYMNILFKTPDQIFDEAETKLQGYLQTILKYQIDNRGKNALNSMKKVIRNIIDNPDTPKFRSFNVKSKSFAGIFEVAGFFVTLGFQGSEEKPDCLECGNINDDYLNLALRKLNELQ
jgi:hypothetical protein